MSILTAELRGAVGAWYDGGGGTPDGTARVESKCCMLELRFNLSMAALA